MGPEDIEPEMEFSPTQAFVYALDDAIQTTVNCLSEAGMTDKMIWAAFRKAIHLVDEAARQIDDKDLSSRYATTINVES